VNNIDYKKYKNYLRQIIFLFNLDKSILYFDCIEGENIYFFQCEDLLFFSTFEDRTLSSYIILKNENINGFYKLIEAKKCLPIKNFMHILIMSITSKGYKISIDDSQKLPTDIKILITKLITIGPHGTHLVNKNNEKPNLLVIENNNFSELFIWTGYDREFLDSEIIRWKKKSLVGPNYLLLKNKNLW
jgi:hypothetical protein